MSIYALTPFAKADIFDIWCYIAEDSEDAANRVEQAIYEACAFVAEAPLRGHSRRDLTTRSHRFWTVTRYPNYSVVYRPEPPPSGRRGSAREEKYTAYPETAMMTSLPEISGGISLPLANGYPHNHLSGPRRG